MDYIRTSKEILKEWVEANMSTHTDWTGTRVETKHKCESIDKFIDYEQMLSYDWEGDEEIFISEEECSKSFIKPKILGCNENEEVLPNL